MNICTYQLRVNSVDTKKALDVSCELIDKYYRDIVLSVNDTCRNCILCRRSHGNISEYVTPGWNDFVADKHHATGSAFLDWVVAGKPRSGLNMIMRRTRSQFKLALRYCKQHEANIRSNVLAKSLFAKDYNKFWKSVSRSNNSKAVNDACVISGCTGDVDIANRWRTRFEDLYNYVNARSSALQCRDRFMMNVLLKSYKTYISVYDVVDACL